MTKSLKFSHKILLAACSVVVLAFTSFSFYNDYLQRSAIERQLNSYMAETGQSTASNIQSWLTGRVLLVEGAAESVAAATDNDAASRALNQKTLLNTFLGVYFGRTSGAFMMQPPDDTPADYDPRARPWYQAAIAAGKTVLTEPYIDTVTKSLLMTIAVPAKTETGQVLGVA